MLIGTFLPIVEFNLDTINGAAGDSINGWDGDINDGPIHVVFGLIPLLIGILVLKNGARTWMKVLLILSAVIGFFWVSARFADISGSLEEGELADIAAEVLDPGVGLYVITFGWVLVLVAGIVAKAVKQRPVA